MPNTIDAATASTPVAHVVMKMKGLFFSSFEAGLEDSLFVWGGRCKGDPVTEGGFSPSAGAEVACDEFTICSLIRGSIFNYVSGNSLWRPNSKPVGF